LLAVGWSGGHVRWLVMGEREEIALRAEGVSKRFGRRELFAEVDLELGRGERVALLGPSGSGKTTLLHCLGGVESIDGGSVTWLGEELSEMGADELVEFRRHHVGTVFQFFHLLPTLTAAENVELPMQLIGVERGRRQKRAMELLDRMGVGERAKGFPNELSGGEMQRVAMARALAHQPAILFADEPTGNLDADSGERVLELLRRACEEERTALVMVTHSEEAAMICQRRFRFSHGRLKEEGASVAVREGTGGSGSGEAR